MKKIAPFLLACFFSPALLAQDVYLNDSVIFINNKPVALYSRSLSNSAPRYNMELYSFSKAILIKAEIIKFPARVEELKPFYYYELTFPPINDTLSVYIEDQAFPIVLSELIRDYKLISNDQLDKSGVDQLKMLYPGGPALLAKIKEVEDYLDASRNFSAQVVRDRNKPVIIVNNRTIIQDSIKIGFISNTDENLPVVNQSQQIRQIDSQSDYNKTTADAYTIYLLNEREANRYRERFFAPLRKGDKGYQLYELSKTKELVPGSVDDLILQKVCFLIEDYAL